MLLAIASLSLICCAPAGAVLGIPREPVQDAVMASAAERAALLDWAERAFGNPSGAGSGLELTLRRQDHSVLRVNRSCVETPLRIGGRAFEHGLGTHSNSEIAVRLPDGAQRFRAFCGVDNNDDTGGKRGSVVCSVEVDGKECFRSGVLRGGDEPVPVDVELPGGARELVLKVDGTDDGPACDQADWADAEIGLADGIVRRLDEGQSDSLLGADRQPFSFVYGGASSDSFLSTWQRVSERRDTDTGPAYAVAWTDPATGLRVAAEARVFARYAAAEWLLTFTNTGSADTPILENIQALDVALRSGYAKNPLLLHRNSGDSCDDRSFLESVETVAAGKAFRMAPVGGRPSNQAFPFFRAQYGAEQVVAVVGWSGQWAASVERSGAGPARLRAGMEETHFTLHPGESVRSPRILLMPGGTDTWALQNRFRRLMLFEYVPKADGRPVALPAALQCFDRYVWTRDDWATEAGQLAAARFAKSAGFDTLWLDAAWFEGGFPNGVGNWYYKPKAFPDGLKPVGDLCDELGLKFVVWFEPERVAKGSEIAREHPDYVFGGGEGGLFRLDLPEAREWLTELLSRRIAESGIDIYRNDFNIDPLDYWRGNDAPDRRGITEIRYVEGLYRMWDDLRARHPGLMIDNCASGGRRIDLELCMRSIPFWRSDTNCSPSHCDWNQAQTLGMCPYVPLNMACAWQPDAYEMRSAGTAGIICQWHYMDGGFPLEEGRKALAEVMENRPYWYGDLYPVAGFSPDEGHWCAFQFHRPDLDAGLVLVFRRAKSAYTGMAAGLRGVRPDGSYEVTFIDGDHARTTKTMTGAELGAAELRLPEARGSLIVRYRAAG